MVDTKMAMDDVCMETTTKHSFVLYLLNSFDKTAVATKKQ